MSSPSRSYLECSCVISRKRRHPYACATRREVMQGVTDVLAYGTAMHVEPSRKSR
jgi:hypothetical protein